MTIKAKTITKTTKETTRTNNTLTGTTAHAKNRLSATITAATKLSATINVRGRIVH